MIELIRRADLFGNKIGIISEGEEYSYKTLLRLSSFVSLHLLQGKKSLAGARVAFLVNPGFEYVKIQWGIWRAGGVAVPMHPGHPFLARKYTIDDSQSAIIIVQDGYGEDLEKYALEKGIRIIKTGDIIPNKGLLPEIDPEEEAMILYTSGTTGSPKGVVTTHNNIRSQIISLVKAWKWADSDHILNVLPLHHVHGIVNVLCCALWSGATCEFLPKFSPEGVFKVLKEDKLTLFMAVPTIYFKLISYWESLSSREQKAISRSLKRLRLMVSGSAALPVSVMERWEAISGHTLLERYGMTEIGMALTNPYEGMRKPGYVGLPLPGVAIRRVDENQKEVIEGDQGEIQVKGPSVFKCYFNNLKATSEAFTNDGWFKTGDIAICEKGYYKILGRSSVDIIKSGGYKISALEIEEVIRRYPGINNCAVVGIPDEEWGEIVSAAIVKEKPELEIDPEVLKHWIQTKIPDYKTPRKYLFLKELPCNAMGKVSKNEVKQYFTEPK